MRISELAAATHETPSTIRFYESRGLLIDPRRTPHGYRDYNMCAIDQIRFIRTLQGAGLTLDEIAAIVEISNNPEPPSPHDVQTVAAAGTRLDRHLETLTRMRNCLTALRRNGTDPSSAQQRCTGAPEIPIDVSRHPR